MSTMQTLHRGRRPRALTVVTVLAYALLTLLILGSVALGFGYAHAESQANAYAAAGPCHGSEQTGCVLDSTVDLIDAGEKSGKSATYWFEVLGTAVPDQTIDLSCPDDAGFFMTAQGLGPLTAKSWDGIVISLTYQGAACGSQNAPTSKAQLWLMGLGVVASISLGWLTLLARRLVRAGRAKWIAGTASAPFYMNILIFPVLLGSTGSHSALLYPPAYAIGAVIAVPLAVAGARSPRRRLRQRGRPAAQGNAPSRTSGRASSPQIHWYGSQKGDAASFTGLAQERPHRLSGRTVNYTLLGVVTAGALTLLGFYIPAQANAFAYENAPTCAGSASAGCVKQETATVVDTGSYEKDDSSFADWIEIRGPGVPDTQFVLGGDCPDCVTGAVKPGGPITVRLWKGAVVELDADGFTAPGPTTPQKNAAELLGGAYAVFGILAFWLIVMAAVEVRSVRRRHVVLCAGFVVLAGAGFAFGPLLAEARPVLWALPLTLAISAVFVVPIYLLAVALSRRSARKRRERLGGKPGKRYARR